MLWTGEKKSFFAIQKTNFVDIQSSRFRWYSFVFERTQSRLVFHLFSICIRCVQHYATQTVFIGLFHHQFNKIMLYYIYFQVFKSTTEGGMSTTNNYQQVYRQCCNTWYEEWTIFFAMETTCWRTRVGFIIFHHIKCPEREILKRPRPSRLVIGVCCIVFMTGGTLCFRVVRPSVTFRGTTLHAAPSKNYAFSTNYHACIAMPTWPRCAPPILCWPWSPYNLLPRSCLT